MSPPAVSAGQFTNGSFETGDYTGWTLFESAGRMSDGTWGIATSGQTIPRLASVFNFFDGISVEQTSYGLPHTYYATDGNFVALQLQNGSTIHRMYQDIALPAGAASIEISWDLEYNNQFGAFLPGNQSLRVHVRSATTDAVLATLFHTAPGDQLSIQMTHFVADVSAFGGQTVRISVDLNSASYYFDATFDNFEVAVSWVPDPDPESIVSRVLVIDEESLAKDAEPNGFSEDDVNEAIADIGLRAQLPYFKANVGRRITLHTGEVGDEGWFALKTIPSSWDAAGPTSDGLRNYIEAGPGLGSGGDREALLDKIPDVTPLRATGLRQLQLEGVPVCAVVYKGNVSINYDPLEGSLKGDNLGTVAFEVLSVTRLTGHSSSSLPMVQIEILDADAVCGGVLTVFAGAPEPTSSSEPFDVR